MMRRTRVYGLFERRRSDGHGAPWTRLYPGVALSKELAVRLFQDALLAPFLGGCDRGLERCLRPVGHEAVGER
jgi:hypothetical protein